MHAKYSTCISWPSTLVLYNKTSYRYLLNNMYLKLKINIWSDHSLDGAFQGQWNQLMKQIMQMNITWIKIPTGRRQTSLLFTSMTEELNSGLPRNNSSLVVRAGLEPVTSGFQVRRPNQSATLPPLLWATNTIPLSVSCTNINAHRGKTKERIHLLLIDEELEEFRRLRSWTWFKDHKISQAGWRSMTSVNVSRRLEPSVQNMSKARVWL